MAFQRKEQRGTAPVMLSGTEDGVQPEWRVVERVFAERPTPGKPLKRQYYVKWSMLGYAESTWEDESDLKSPEVPPSSPVCAPSALPAVSVPGRCACAPSRGAGGSVLLTGAVLGVWLTVSAFALCCDNSH